MSRQTESPRWVVDSIEDLRDLKPVDPVLTRVENVSRGIFSILSGRREGRPFSIPIKEDLLSKIPGELPQELYCIFLEEGRVVRLAEVLRKKEYEIFSRAIRLLSEMDRECAESENVVDAYLKSIQPSSTIT